MPWLKEHYKELNRKRVHKRRVLLLAGKVCERCGFSDTRALQFHHKDPSTKSSTVSAIILHKMSKLMAEVAKCEVLCANCHAIEHSTKSWGLSDNGSTPALQAGSTDSTSVVSTLLAVTQLR